MIEQIGGPSTHPEIGVDKPNGGGGRRMSALIFMRRAARPRRLTPRSARGRAASSPVC
jgi:hypothetical protein